MDLLNCVCCYDCFIVFLGGKEENRGSRRLCGVYWCMESQRHFVRVSSNRLAALFVMMIMMIIQL